MSRPPSAMVPPNRRVMSTMELIRVVLPVPLRPNNASTWLSARRKDMFGNTTASPYPARRPSMERSSDIGGLAEVDRLQSGVERNLFWRTLDQLSAYQLLR